MDIERIIVLDVFWDTKGNGGRLEDIVRGFNDPKEYQWLDYTNNTVYRNTIKNEFWLFERNQINPLDAYSGFSCHSYEDYFDKIPEKYEVAFNQLYSESKSTTVFLSTCRGCGDVISTTLNTYARWDNFYCNPCNKRINAVNTYGSLAEARPDIIPYYTKENKYSIETVPMYRKNAKDNKIYLICPRCKKPIVKRLDAVERTGAYCQQCVRIIEECKKGKSLRAEYPYLADLVDACEENTIKSNEILSGSSSLTVWVKCEGTDEIKPHKYQNIVVNLVNAYKNGNKGCPICAGKQLLKGINDFKTVLGDRVSAWDYELNDCNPEDVYYRSEKQYHFICPKGHKFMKDPLHMSRAVGTSTLGCPYCHGKKVLIGDNDLYSQRPDVMKYWDYELNTKLSPKDVTQYSNSLAWFRCVNCGKPYFTEIDIRCMTRGYCEDCQDRGWSEEEKELFLTIQSWGIAVEENVKLFGDRRSVDIYIPNKNIAIEFNGVYWHCEDRVKDPNTHYRKYVDCKKLGIELIYVWEDDYIFKKDIVLKMLQRKLGISKEEKVNARDCYVDYVKYEDTIEFLNANHIQGSCTGSIYQALRVSSSDKIVAVAIYQATENVLTLRRFCSSCIVRGGFSKLISAIENDTEGFRCIETFSDNGVSNGALYQNNGFVLESRLKPDYSYLVEGKRVHKFNYRLSRFKNDPNLIYKEGLSERELAIINSLHRVYDAGKLKWCRYLRRDNNERKG